jgi:hypothetical protein
MKYFRLLTTSLLFVAGLTLVGGLFHATSSKAAAGSSVLNAGETLTEGQMLNSPDGRYHAVLQTDGNFVVYGPTGALWWDGLRNTYGANTIVMQSDGNLVAYLWNGLPLWNAGTMGSGGSMLAMQDDGNLVVYTASGKPVWSTGTSQTTLATPPDQVPPSLLAQEESSTLTLGRDGGISIPIPALNEDFWIFGDTPIATYGSGVTSSNSSILSSGHLLNEGQALTSSNGLYTAVLQTDGNFVVYGPNGAMWADMIFDHFGPNHVVMQPDGNLVAYLWTGFPLWNSGTMGSGGANLVMQNDGNLVIYAGNGKPVWSTHTAQPSAPAAWRLTGFIENATAATQSLSSLTNAIPQSLSEVGGLSQFMQPPSGLTIPNTTTPCTAGSNGVLYPARWVAGATLLPPSSSSTTILIAYDNVCVMGSGYYPEGWGYVLYDAAGGQMGTYHDVFMSNSPDYIHTTIGQLVVDPNGTSVDFYQMCTISNTNGCRSSLSYDQIPINDLVNNPAAVASDFPAHPPQLSRSDGGSWNPFLIDVRAASSTGPYYMIEQTDLNGSYVMLKSSSPTSGWTAYASGTLPNCATINTAQFCYAVAVHPEIQSSGSQLYLTYFDPAAGPDPGFGHLVVTPIPRG